MGALSWHVLYRYLSPWRAFRLIRQRTGKTELKFLRILLTSAEVGQRKERSQHPGSLPGLWIARLQQGFVGDPGPAAQGPLRMSPVSGTGRTRLPGPQLIQICIICWCVDQGYVGIHLCLWLLLMLDKFWKYFCSVFWDCGNQLSLRIA